MSAEAKRSRTKPLFYGCRTFGPGSIGKLIRGGPLVRVVLIHVSHI